VKTSFLIFGRPTDPTGIDPLAQNTFEDVKGGQELYIRIRIAFF